MTEQNEQFDMNKAEQEATTITTGPLLGDLKTEGWRSFVYGGKGWIQMYKDSGERAADYIDKLAAFFGLDIEKATPLNDPYSEETLRNLPVKKFIELADTIDVIKEDM